MCDRLSLACLTSFFTESLVTESSSLFTECLVTESFPSHSTVWASLPRVSFVSRSRIYTYICVFIHMYIYVWSSLSSVFLVSPYRESRHSLCLSRVFHMYKYTYICIYTRTRDENPSKEGRSHSLVKVCVSLECLSSRSTAWASLSRVSFVSLNR